MIHRLYTPSDGETSARQADPPPPRHAPPIIVAGTCSTSSTPNRVVHHMHLPSILYLQDESWYHIEQCYRTCTHKNIEVYLSVVLSYCYVIHVN
jgi:hypothetical protein